MFCRFNCLPYSLGDKFTLVLQIFDWIFACKIRLVDCKVFACEIRLVHCKAFACKIRLVHCKVSARKVRLVHCKAFACKIRLVHCKVFACKIRLVHCKVLLYCIWKGFEAIVMFWAIPTVSFFSLYIRFQAKWNQHGTGHLPPSEN